MGIKMISKVTSKRGSNMDSKMGNGVTNDIGSIMCIKISKKDG